MIENTNSVMKVAPAGLSSKVSKSPEHATANVAPQADTYQFSSKALQMLEQRLLAEDAERFGEIAMEAHDRNAIEDPKAFLRQLSDDDLEILRKAHSMAASINVDKLNTEGAYNLLLPPHEGIDLDGNGYISVGEGRFNYFPLPSMSEQDIEDWETATAHLSTEDREYWERRITLSHSLSWWSMEYTDGHIDGDKLPSFAELVDLQLSTLHLSFSRGDIDRHRYEQGTDFLSKLQEIRQGES